MITDVPGPPTASRGEVAALLGQRLDPADVEPGLLEDRLLLELVVLRVDGVLVVHWRGAEFRPILGPAPDVRFLEELPLSLPLLSSSTPKVFNAIDTVT
jgi:hypothetical protein